MRCVPVLLIAFFQHMTWARRITDNLDNEINRNSNEIDIGKKIVDWVRISVPPSNMISRQAGSMIELECEAVGSPAPTLQWLKGNRPLTENESFDSNIINDNPSRGLAKVRTRLIIHSALSIHEGTYTCLAESGSQVASAKSNVYILANPATEKNFTQMFNEDLLISRNQPRITLYESIYMDNIGSDIILPCKVTGNPRPSIIWLDPSERIVDNDPRLTVFPDGELRIKNIRWNDMGPYTCVARNSLGQDNITTFVYPMLAEK